MQEGVLFYVFSFLLFFLTSLFSGFLLLRVSGIDKLISGSYARIFTYCLCGLIFLVLLYSIFKSGGITINLFFIPILILLYFVEKTPAQIVKRKSENLFRVVSTVAASALFPFCYFGFVMYKSGTFHWNGADYDNVMYAKLVEELAGSGQENKWFMYFSDTAKVHGLEPYHYFECWVNALSYQIFKTNPVLGFYLVVYPLLLSISILGVLALFELFKKPGWLDVGISIALLFLGPIYQIKMSGYQENRMSCEIPWQCYGEKFSAYYPFVLSSLLLLLKGQQLRSYIALLSLCVISSTVLPALLLYYFILILFSKQRKFLLYTSVPFMLLYILFYSIGNSSSEESNSLLSYTDLAPAEFSFTWIKLAVSNFCFSFFINLKNFALTYFWIIPIFYLGFKELPAIFRNVCTPLLICFFGLAVSSVLFKHPDGHQLFTNTLTILHVVVICLLVVLLGRQTGSNLLVKGLQSFIVLLALNNAVCSLVAYKESQKNIDVSDEYLTAVKILTEGKPSKKVGLLCTKDDYVTYFIQRKHNSLYHLSYLRLDPLPVNLSSNEVTQLPDSLMWKYDYLVIREADTFYEFARNRKQEIDSLRSQFIEQSDLRYILLTPNYPYPDFLQKYHPKILLDPMTKLRFVYLNY